MNILNIIKFNDSYPAYLFFGERRHFDYKEEQPDQVYRTEN